MKKILLIFLFAFLSLTESYGVIAYPYPIKYTQPDGTIVTILLKGDEYVKWAETEDGYSLLRNGNGAWEYAKTDDKGDLVCSGILAKEIKNRSMADNSFLVNNKKHLRYSRSQVNTMKAKQNLKSANATSSFTPTGSKEVLMILMDFPDKPFTKTQTDFDNLMNQVDYNGTGSLKDFYLENSYNQFSVNTTVVGPYTAANDMVYYGGNNNNGNDSNPDALMTEAMAAADAAGLDFAPFDNDGDGVLDVLYVIYAGYGEEAGGGSNTDAIWAHAGGLSPVEYDGVTINRYACSCELKGNSGTTTTGIGVICHEFGHSCGAKDYYDTNYDTDGQYDGTGQWDMMAGGSWNGYGDTPAHHNAYTKAYVYNWLTPTVINSNQAITVNLRDIKDNKDVVRINTPTTNEYFLCENRQLTGFNAALPGHGMLIYHVDGSHISEQSGSNTINVGAHQGIYPVSAIANTDNGIMLSSEGKINVSGCPWPGSSNKTMFDNKTTPNMNSWAVESNDYPFSNISESSGIITFNIDVSNPSNFVASAFNTSQIDLSWTLSSDSDPVIVAVNTTNTFGTPAGGTAYVTNDAIPGGGTVIYFGSATSFNHVGLTANTNYFYKIWSKKTGNIYSTGNTNNVSTLPICTGIDNLPFAETFDGTTIPDCWSQVDHQGNGQVWEFGTATFGNPPDLTGNYAYLNSYIYVNSTQNVDLVTPSFDFSAYAELTLEFDHYYADYDDSDWATLSYSIDNGSTWTEINQWTATTANPAYFSQAIAAVAGQSQVKFKWNYTGTYGWGWAIDNISITGTGYFWTGAAGSDWNVAGNWSNTTVPSGTSNVTIPNVGNHPVISDGITVECNNLTIEPGAQLEISAGNGLTVLSDLLNNGTFIVNSDATNSGSLIVKGSSTGNVTYNRWMTADKWHIVSVPVEGQDSATFIANTNNAIPSNGSNYAVTHYIESTNDWGSYYQGGTSGAFESGLGYLMRRQTDDGTLSFTGTLATNVNVPVTKAGVYGWNCVGNPYPSAIRVTDDNNASTTEFLTVNADILDDSFEALYVWDHTASSGAGDYVIINHAGIGNGTEDAWDTDYVQSGQGFIVRANADGDVTFTTAMQSHQTGQTFKSAEIPWPGIVITADRNGEKTSTSLAFNDYMTKGLDPGYDAGVFKGGNDFYVYTQLPEDNGVDFGLQCLPTQNMESLEIPIGIDATEGGEIIFSLQKENLPADVIPVLIDKELRTQTAFAGEENSYSVNIGDNTKGYGRFMLSFAGTTIANEIRNNQPAFKVWYSNGKVNIDGEINGVATMAMYDIQGRKLITKTLNSTNRNTISIAGLNSGIYLVNIKGTETSYTTKVIITE